MSDKHFSEGAIATDGGEREVAVPGHTDSALALATANKEASAQLEQQYQPPDGGLDAWLCVVAGCCIFINSWGLASSFGAFQSHYQNVLFPDQSSSAISWIGSIQSTFVTVTGLVVGPLTDRGYIRPIVIVGHFMIVFGLMMTSLVTEYWQALLAQGFCVGIGAGALVVPIQTLVASHFTTNRQVAVSFMSTGSSIGGVFYPIMFRRLQPQLGFGWAVRSMGFVALALSLVACGIMCRKPGVKAKKSRAVIDIRAFREPSFAFFAGALCLSFLAYFFPLFYITSYAITKLNTSEDFGFYLTSITNGASFFGRLLPVWLRLFRTEVPALNMLAFWIVVGVILLYTWITVSSVAGFVVWCCAWGLLTGAVVTTTTPAVAHPTISPTMGQLGGRMGMAWASSSIGILIGSPIAGALVDVSTAQYTKAQAFAGAMMAGGAASLAIPVWRARVFEQDKEKQRKAAAKSEQG